MGFIGYSTDFKEKVLEIIIRDKMLVRNAALYFGVCTGSIQQSKKSTVAMISKRHEFIKDLSDKLYDGQQLEAQSLLI